MANTAFQVLVSPFLEVLFENISSLIRSEVALVWGVQKQMEKLARTISTVRAVLHDAEEKKLNNEAITKWLSELKDAAYDADDVLDECAFHSLQMASELRRNSCTKQVTDSFKQIKLRHKIGKRIKVLCERFDEIAEQRSKFHLKEGTVEMQPGIFQNRETSSIFTEPEVYGRDEDRENLVALLLDNLDGQEDISICAVLGIGGLGKTTLAQLVYNDERVAEHFERRSWVCVSDDFDVKRLIKAIIVSLSGKPCYLEELDPLQCCLQEELRGKRFLLVLDDVWNENQDDWNKLKGSLTCAARGSSVIVTTRLETVASITGALLIYDLQVLSEDDCWSLFRQRAFASMNEERPNLVEIGKEIVKKCAGVPLAAKALGGLLRFNTEENKWLSLRDSEIWDLPKSDENNILPALRLSYDHLPSHLRQCFAYCSIIPKDCRIEKEQLIHLWIANGLVHSNGRMELEDVGNEIFNALLVRSFFQDIENDEDGNINMCKMHDLVHDLACHIAKEECSIMDVTKVDNITRRTRHLSLDLIPRSSSSHQVESVLKSSPCLRSLVKFMFLGPIPVMNLQFIFSCLIRLRALDLRMASINELPNSIGKMKHLRYLNLSYNDIISLPESICRLGNVQTLILHWCSKLTMLPRGMRNMIKLRHLDIRKCNYLTKMPIEMGNLTCLQTLSKFIVGWESGLGIRELQGLNLGGELKIKELENVQNPIDAKETLVRKKNLHSLWLSWSEWHWQVNSSEVIEGLQPHSNLRRLFIKGYEGVSSPSWLKGSSLPNLITVSLSRLKKCEHLSSPLGKLPNLKVLKMKSMDSLKSIDDEFYGDSEVKGFPALEKLELVSMPKLEKWSSSQPRGCGERALFPCLRELVLKDCPKLIVVSLPSSLQIVTVKKCNEMLLGSLQNLPCLLELEIDGFDELLYFPDGMLQNLTALEELEISYCKKLKALPVELESLTTLTQLSIGVCHDLVSLPEGLRNLTFLKHLRIGNCDGLRRLPELGMSNLETLHIYHCLELDISAEDFQHLVILEKLTLQGLPKLICLPDGMKHTAATLQRLTIWDCSNLMELPNWIGTLTLLQKLEIDDCKNLKVLPEGMQHLTALHDLDIRGCDFELKRRCEKEKGEDWYKISHIPKATIEPTSSG